MKLAVQKNSRTLAIFGFTRVENALITGVCRLSQVREKQCVKPNSLVSYYIQDIATAQQADFYLVDIDNTEAVAHWSQIREPDCTKPTIFASNKPFDTEKSNEYTLARNRLGGLLLRKLDNVVAAQTQEASSVVESPKPLSPAIQNPWLRSKQCLVVDDSQLVQTQMALIFKEYGVSAEFADDAETALQLVRSNSYDLIFLDVILPEMNGYKACKQLKSNPSTSATPVVMLTSKKSPFNKMHGALVGCDKYLTKPVDPTKLYQTLIQYGLIERSHLIGETAGVAIG